MSIHNNTAFHATATTSIPSGSGSYQTSSSINSRVEEVAFDVLFSQELDTEQLRFKLSECGKAGPQYYTIVTWKGKRYRITVHNNKKPLQLSEKVWQDTAKLLSEKVLNKYQGENHFFTGTLQLHTQRKWIATYEKNKTPKENQVSKSIIKNFKKLLEKEIPRKTLSSEKPKEVPYSLNTTYKPAKKEDPSFEPLGCLESCKTGLKKVANFFINRFFSSNNNINNFDGLSSAASTRSSEEINDQQGTEDIYNNGASSLKGSSFEEVHTPEENDLNDNFSDTTSLGGKSDTSSNVSNDNGSSYSPEIKR